MKVAVSAVNCVLTGVQNKRMLTFKSIVSKLL